MKVLYSARFEMVKLLIGDRPFRANELCPFFPSYTKKNLAQMLSYWWRQQRVKKIDRGLYEVK